MDGSIHIIEKPIDVLLDVKPAHTGGQVATVHVTRVRRVYRTNTTEKIQTTKITH